MAKIKLSNDVLKEICCPVCKSPLKSNEDSFGCENSKCMSLFPIINGIPVILNESSSIFAINDFIETKETTFQHESKIKRFISDILPENSKNIKADENFSNFKKLLFKNSEKPKVLVIGGSIVGNGMKSLISDQSIDLVESDVSFGPRTNIILDSHDIPFRDNSLDGVIVQAVLEHVVDPYRCVEEIHRVLKDDGIVYAETPFMQQVHMGKYDFTRFTHLGHRRLFRDFNELCSGATGGPGMALAWSYQYFLLSFSKSEFSRNVVKAFARITSFWLKYFDNFLVDKPGTLDAAFGYYFMGRKSKYSLPDKKLVQLYSGIDL